MTKEEHIPLIYLTSYKSLLKSKTNLDDFHWTIEVLLTTRFMNFTSNLFEIVFTFQLEKLDFSSDETFTVRSEEHKFNGRVKLHQIPTK